MTLVGELKRVVRLFYGFQFFFGLLLWVPIFYEYQRRVGLVDRQIFGIQSIYYLAFCVFEIPTGVLADLWGRRLCMRLGAGLVMLSNLLPIFAPTYTGFVAHFLLVALARSLISGASSAYIYDFMKLGGAETAYREVEGKARAYGLVGKVFCWGAVGALMEWRLTTPYWLTLGANGIGLLIALRLPELPRAARRDGFKISAVMRSFSLAPVLPFIMLQGVAVFVLERICQVNLYQPILGAKGFELRSYGWIMALMALFEATGALRNRPGHGASGYNSVGWGSLALSLSLFLIPGASASMTLVYLCSFALVTGWVYPIQRQLMNDAIPDSAYRATLLSLESILDRAVCAAVAAILGMYLAHGQLNRFIQLAALGTFALVWCVQSALMFWQRRQILAGHPTQML